MSDSDDFRRKAYRYLQMASECADPPIAKALRMLAADFFDLADETAPQPIQEQEQKAGDLPTAGSKAPR